jgi:hypothetical protein
VNRFRIVTIALGLSAGEIPRRRAFLANPYPFEASRQPITRKIRADRELMRKLEKQADAEIGQFPISEARYQAAVAPQQ